MTVPTPAQLAADFAVRAAAIREDSGTVDLHRRDSRILGIHDEDFMLLAAAEVAAEAITAEVLAVAAKLETSVPDGYLPDDVCGRPDCADDILVAAGPVFAERILAEYAPSPARTVEVDLTGLDGLDSAAAELGIAPEGVVRLAVSRFLNGGDGNPPF
ncbi:hypothetical protein [Leifsonia sp. Leaf264]|uniref:hypothetical protein n=1 Tax=Leifsonia sp. Leaf264 TaxID=1736314 RepID=UPI0006F53DFB|nr:hypothetical protein [Leifsonia sp. Leaf264]KQO98258.1 hypothetical protein ASF30_09360 [Leifsonia sp. Leaf264]